MPLPLLLLLFLLPVASVGAPSAAALLWARAALCPSPTCLAARPPVRLRRKPSWMEASCRACCRCCMMRTPRCGPRRCWPSGEALLSKAPSSSWLLGGCGGRRAWLLCLPLRQAVRLAMLAVLHASTNVCCPAARPHAAAWCAATHLRWWPCGRPTAWPRWWGCWRSLSRGCRGAGRGRCWLGLTSLLGAGQQLLIACLAWCQHHTAQQWLRLPMPHHAVCQPPCDCSHQACHVLSPPQEVPASAAVHAARAAAGPPAGVCRHRPAAGAQVRSSCGCWFQLCATWRWACRRREARRLAPCAQSFQVFPGAAPTQAGKRCLPTPHHPAARSWAATTTTCGTPRWRWRSSWRPTTAACALCSSRCGMGGGVGACTAPLLVAAAVPAGWCCAGQVVECRWCGSEAQECQDCGLVKCVPSVLSHTAERPQCRPAALALRCRRC